LKWVYVQTFNDFNEGTEIEPSAEFRYNYLISTINNINAFKNTNISIDTCKFEAALKIYAAADSIELKRRDSTGYYSCLRKAIKYLISDKYDSVFYYANCIITDSKCSECYIPGTNNYEYNVSNFEIYPNPADDKLCFENKNNRPYMVQIINILGNTLLKKQFTNSFETINISNIPKGIYLVKIIQDNNLFAKKIVVRQL
jgi:hypothetical protein